MVSLSPPPAADPSQTRAGRVHGPLRFADRDVRVERRGDGTTLLRHGQPLRPYARAVTEWLLGWGATDPARPFLAERSGDSWRTVSYGEAAQAVQAIGQALLDRGLGAARPVAILSDNSVDHALLALGAMHVGVPVAPISPAYSLMSGDFAKLRHIVALLQPGLVWCADRDRFAAALLVVAAQAPAAVQPISVADLCKTEVTPAVDRAHRALTPDTVAKILFTSGSTGVPKGVLNTHRMLCANQQMLAQVWPFLEDRPPRLVDWLPWNHTFGGNFCFHLVLRNGGTLHIDGGKPLPGAIEVTARNLRDVSPTLYFNVPRGFDLLLPLLEADGGLRHSFFRELDMLFYAAAALPQNLWTRLQALARTECDGPLAMLSAWGSTETSPCATAVHFPIDRAGVVGLPLPGCELKLVPSGDKQEVRLRGPHITPGYLRDPEKTAVAFDDEGFYRIGDALRWADPDDPQQGLLFDGRVAEDFKLSTGTWVHGGALRVRLIAAANPVVQDAVLTGHDRDEVGALLFLSPAVADWSDAAIRARLVEALAALARDGGSSTHPSRLIILRDPPSIDAGEITDKGYINHRAVLNRRAAIVEQLHASPPAADVSTMPGMRPGR